jgi:hypothetical protein
VWSPEERKIPPPTRLFLASCRASLASLKEFGFTGAAEGSTGAAARSGEVDKGREDTGLSRASPAVTFCIRSTFGPVLDLAECKEEEATGSTISIGTRRIFLHDRAEKDGAVAALDF